MVAKYSASLIQGVEEARGKEGKSPWSEVHFFILPCPSLSRCKASAQLKINVEDLALKGSHNIIRIKCMKLKNVQEYMKLRLAPSQC